MHKTFFFVIYLFEFYLKYQFITKTLTTGYVIYVCSYLKIQFLLQARSNPPPPKHEILKIMEILIHWEEVFSIPLDSISRFSDFFSSLPFITCSPKSGGGGATPW